MSLFGQNFGSVFTMTSTNHSGRGSMHVGGGKIVIDGREYEGNHVIFNKDGITIDGKSITAEDDKKYKVTSITVQGNVTGDVESSSADVTVHGDVQGSISTQSGNCLLYTSPSPRDLSTSRMPSSA